MFLVMVHAHVFTVKIATNQASQLQDQEANIWVLSHNIAFIYVQFDVSNSNGLQFVDKL